MLKRLFTTGGVTVTGAVAISAFEGALLQRKFGFFTGGFLAEQYLRTWPKLALFAAVGLLSDAAVIALVAALVWRMLSRTRLAGATRAFLSLAAAVAPIVVYNFVTYQVLEFLGSGFDLGVMLNLAQGRVKEMAAVASGHVMRPAVWILAGGAAILAAAWCLQRWAGRHPEAANDAGGPRVVPLIGLCVVALVAQGGARALDWDVAYGFRWKASGRLADLVYGQVLDFDRDGWTILSRPPDSAPFDRRVHPYAIDEPGNGLDEDGAGGDLPLSQATYREGAATAPPFVRKPDLVVVFLEGVRADSVGRVVNGRPVTPVIDALARQGISVPVAVSHNGSTVQSRYNLMVGSLAELRGRASLVDDFNANGYFTVYLSGQDESFGTPRFDVGFDRAAVHWDAREDIASRFSTFATPGSLEVSAEVVLAELRSILRERVPAAQPLFLYINFGDTHFPYHHEGLKPLVSSLVVPREDIEPERAAAVREMYDNTVANVDAAIGDVLEAVTRARGSEPAVVVTGDHGEGLFDQGYLGHGLALEDSQLRVPFVVRGVPIALPPVFGPAGFRDALWEALANPQAASAGPRLTDSAPGVFVYSGDFAQPAQIGLIWEKDRVRCDMRELRCRLGEGASLGMSQIPSPDRERVEHLVWTWESMLLVTAHSR